MVTAMFSRYVGFWEQGRIKSKMSGGEMRGLMHLGKVLELEAERSICPGDAWWTRSISYVVYLSADKIAKSYSCTDTQPVFLRPVLQKTLSKRWRNLSIVRYRLQEDILSWLSCPRRT